MAAAHPDTSRDRRLFLGWAQPVVTEVCRLLIETFAEAPGICLAHLTLVVPSKRASRLILSALTAAAEQVGAVLVPPHMITFGELPEQFYIPEFPIANDTESALLWLDALRAEPEAVAVLVPRQESTRSLAQLNGVAQQLSSVRSELSATGRSAGDVLKSLIDLHIGNDDRWTAVRSICLTYESLLADRQLTDKHQARAEALSNGVLFGHKKILIIGTLDLPPVARAFLARSGADVEAWIQAPIELEAGFDEYGCVVSTFWKARPLKIDEAKIVLARNNAEQAKNALRTTATWAKKSASHDMAIAALDPEITPHLSQVFGAVGIGIRDVGGIPLSSARPATALSALQRYLDSRTLQDLGTLLRHIDVARYLKRSDVHARYGDRYLEYLDRYQQEALPVGMSSRLPGEGTARDCVAALYQAVETLAGSDTRKSNQPLAAWTKQIRNFLEALYADQVLNRQEMAEKAAFETLEVLLEEIGRIGSLPVTDLPGVAYAEAVGFLLRRISRDTIEPPTNADAVEVIGWLELYMDERPNVIVTGCNERFLPESINEDPFLPNSVRRQLGLADNDLRYARDLVIVETLLHSRAQVCFMLGSIGSNEEILSPSRLLLTDPETRATRVLAFYESFEKESKQCNDEATALSSTTALFPPRPPKDTAGKVKELSVTQFKTYIECPYRFYLRNILQLKKLRDDALELDGRAFGTLGHEVLRRFCANPAFAGERDEKKIKAALHGLLTDTVQKGMGTDLLSTVRIQIEQLRLRLSLFAVWQAAWISKGWRTQKVEFEINGEIATASGALPIAARIDRLDYNPDLREHAVFDYKFSDRASVNVVNLHTVGDRWVGLQLPLYRKLLLSSGPLRSEEDYGSLRLGIIGLSGSSDAVEHQFLDFSDQRYSEAEAEAVRLAQLIIDGVFWPPKDVPSQFDDFAWVCGSGIETEDADDAA